MKIVGIGTMIAGMEVVSITRDGVKCVRGNWTQYLSKEDVEMIFFGT